MPANSIDSKSPLKSDFESVLTLSNQIMHLALCGLLRYDFLKEVSKVLMQSSGSDSVVMWLKERGKFYWSELLRSQKHPFRFEIMPGVEDKERGIIPKLRKNTWLERLSREVFLGRYDSSLSRITPNGSFWTGDAEVDKTKSAADRDYRSVVLVPIRVEKENIGLLELNCKSRDFFTKEDVEICEGFAQTLRVALGYRRAQVELRERVKELTCLYGIAKIVEQGNLSLRDILQKIVMLLPPAWLYPEIASARIILDDQTYATPHYKEGVHKQTAKIVVRGIQKGIIEITYSEEKPELDEGPFLKEERSLMDTVAREIVLIIERTQIEEDKKRLQEVCQLSPSLPDVTADQSQMTQVLVNTVVNAIQAMPNSGKLTIRTLASDKFVTLIVEDTGEGMEKNITNQIFQPFFTTKDVGVGTGLGLSVVYGIVTSHEGSIDVDSKVGRGTRIKIKLPCTEPAEAKGDA